MDCPEAKTALSPHLDGELPRGDAAAVAAHLTACDECRRSFEELRLVSSLIRTQLTTLDTAPSDLVAKVMAAIADLRPEPPRRRAALHRTMWHRLRRMWTGPGAR